MRIISVGIDSSILDRNSKSAKRLFHYGELVDSYTVIVPSLTDSEVALSDKVKVIGIGGSCKALKLFRIYLCIKNIIRREKINVITTQDPFEIAFVAWLASIRKKIGLNIQLHGDFFSNNTWRNATWRNRYRYHIAKEILKKADSIRVVSQKVKKSLVEKLDISENKIVLVPIYVDRQMLPQKVIRQANKNFTYLWIGRFVAEKNLELLLKSFKKVAEARPQSLLRLVGAGVEKEKIVKLANDLGLLAKIEFKDWVRDVDSEYQAADAYVLSSDSEGWGMVVVEAMRNHLPVVMTSVGCAGELVKNNENGIVVPVGDRQALVAGMILMQDKDVRRMYSNNIRRSLQSLANKKETLELYKKSWELALR